MSTIEKARSHFVSRGREEWRAWISSSPNLKAWRSFLRADPYTERALTKPRGFPGDAVVMDFAYQHSSIAESVRQAGELGVRIYQYTSGAPQSESARMRRDRIAYEISEVVSSQTSESVKVVSVAAGHSRELELLPRHCSTHELSRLDYVAIDSDAASTETIRQYSGSFRITTVNKSIFRAGQLDIGTDASFAYSMGLFDYLDDRFACKVLENMASFVAPRGKILVGNLCDTSSNLGYCEAIMDWWMIPRSYGAMIALADVIRKIRPTSDVKLEKLGDFYFLHAVFSE